MSHIFATIVCAVLLVSASLIAGYTRYYYFSAQRSDSLAYLNAISTGVILSAAFTHLLPDAIENLQSFSYPLACLSALAGFLLLVIVETVLTYQTLEDEHKVAEAAHSRHDCAVHNHEVGSSPVHSFLSKGIPSSVYPRVHQKTCAENSECYRKVRSNSFSAYSYGSLDTVPIKGGIHDTSHSHDHQHSREEHQEKDSSALHIDIPVHSHAHSHTHATISPDKSPQAVYAAVYTFWMALVVHSTMEGFGIGVADTFVAQVTVAVAILIHKVFESLALAGLLIDAKLPRAQALSMYATFTAATPFGAIASAVIESYVVEGENANSKVISGVITGMAAGSFMYIGTMEMLPHMLNTCSNMRLGMMCFIFSAAAMAALAAVV